jgi:hypothetical protein
MGAIALVLTSAIASWASSGAGSGVASAWALSDGGAGSGKVGVSLRLPFGNELD